MLLLQAMNFSSYDAYRKLLQHYGGDDALGRGGSFLAGAMAGGAFNGFQLPPAGLDTQPRMQVSKAITACTLPSALVRITSPHLIGTLPHGTKLVA